jgi:membrane-bound serine protease (ClpP class)
MNWILFVILGLGLTLLLVLAAISRHKKSGTGEVQLIGSRAQVDSPLTPEGTVLIKGELWRARSSDGSMIASRATVQVIGLSGHLVVVNRCA